jgi:hypothetical protein
VAPRVSPTEAIRAQINELFGSDGDLLSVSEQVARLSVRLTFQSVIEEVVCDELSQCPHAGEGQFGIGVQAQGAVGVVPGHLQKFLVPQPTLMVHRGSSARCPLRGS